MFVRGTLGEVHTLSDLPCNSKTDVLFDLVESKTGVPARIMRLYFKQKVVQKNKNLQDLKISHGCSIDLILSGNGGGKGSNVAIISESLKIQMVELHL